MRDISFPRLLRGGLICISLMPSCLQSQTIAPAPAPVPSTAPLPALSNNDLRSALGNLPLQFEQNRGQADARARFIARGTGFTLLLNSDGLALHSGPLNGGTNVTMKLLGTTALEPVGKERTVTATNYFLGADPRKWLVDVPSFRSVSYRKVYPGIDLTFHGNKGRLEYDFVIAPGADPSRPRMTFEGLTPSLQGSDLVFKEQDQVSLKALHAYQVVNGEERTVAANWQISGDEVGIHVGQYDHDRELVIDPVFFYGGYIGGEGNDAVVGVVPAGQPGYFYVAMSTNSATIQQPAPGLTNPNCKPACPTDTLILGINASNAPTPPTPFPEYVGSGSSPTLIVSSATYLGGVSGITTPSAMTSDANLNLYVIGSTNVPSSFQQSATQPCTSACNGYVAKFATSLNAVTGTSTVTLQYGLALPAVPRAIVADAAGNAYLAGSALTAATGPRLTIPSTSLSFQAIAAAAIGQTTTPHAFLLELDPRGATLFCSYIGGSGTDQANGLALSGNSLFLVGQTSSSNFPNSAAAYQRAFAGSTDAFVLAARDLSTNPTLIFSNFLGASGPDSASAIAVAPSGNLVITGYTTNTGQSQTSFPIQSSPSFVAQRWPLKDRGSNGVHTYEPPDTAPISVPLPTSVAPGVQDAFVTSLSPDGTKLLFTDFLGGVQSGDVSTADALTLDRTGSIYLAGSTTATGDVAGPTPAEDFHDFLMGHFTGDAQSFQSPYPTYRQMFFAQINPSGNVLLQATLAGGSGSDLPKAIALTTTAAVIVGSTTSLNPNTEVDNNGDPLSNPSLFRAAAVSAVYPVGPPAPTKASLENTTGFFVEEALSGFCDMILTRQNGRIFTFSGPCAAATTSGVAYVTRHLGPAGIPLSVPITFTTVEGALTATVTLDLTGLPGNIAYDISFGFLPVGAIGGVGDCQNDIGSINGCTIVTSGGGGGTIFGVSDEDLAVVLACPGAECKYNNLANTALVGQPLTLTSVVTNGIPNTVTWNASPTAGAFTGPNPAVSIVFTPAGTGGPLVVSALPVVNPTFLPVPTLTLNTLVPTNMATTGVAPLVYGQSTFNILVTSGSGSSTTPTGSVAYQVDGGANGSGVLNLSGGIASFSLPTLAAGNHTVKVDYTPTGGTFFAVASTTATYAVEKAPLTVTATSPTPITFGQPIPSLTYTVTGFVNGESSSVIGGTATLATTATNTSAPGTYPITFATANLTATNYSFTYVPGTLLINAVGTAASPLIQPGSGTYTAAQSVSITTAVPGGKIYFTTDGSAPTTASSLYSAPFTVNGSTTVRAIVAAVGYSNSAPSVSTFTLTAPNLSSSTLNFGSIVQGASSSPQTITLTNQGLNTLTGVTVAIGGANSADFKLGALTACNATLAAGATCSVPVTFSPVAVGTRSASLMFQYSGVGTPLAAALNGTGAPPISITSSASPLVAGTVFQFTASQAVTWTASAGKIDAAGLFTAPTGVSTPTVVTIVATSTADPAIVISIQVTVVPAPLITRPAAVLPAGGTVSLPVSVHVGTGIPGELLKVGCTPATLPTGVYCSFTPNQMPNTGDSTLVLQLFSTNLAVNAHPLNAWPFKRLPFTGVAIAGVLLLFRRVRGRRWSVSLLLPVLLTTMALSMVACGTGGSFANGSSQGTQVKGSFTITVAATGASPAAPNFNQTLTTSNLALTVK